MGGFPNSGALISTRISRALVLRTPPRRTPNLQRRPCIMILYSSFLFRQTFRIGVNIRRTLRCLVGAGGGCRTRSASVAQFYLQYLEEAQGTFHPLSKCTSQTNITRTALLKNLCRVDTGSLHGHAKYPGPPSSLYMMGVRFRRQYVPTYVGFLGKQAAHTGLEGFGADRSWD